MLRISLNVMDYIKICYLQINKKKLFLEKHTLSIYMVDTHLQVFFSSVDINTQTFLT